MPGQIILQVTQGPLKGSEFNFKERTTAIIGRDVDCNPQLPDDDAHRTISRHHCLVDINPPQARIRDLGSLNGTMVNGKRIGRREDGESVKQAARKSYPEYDLVDGDNIQLGDTVFVFHARGPVRCASCRAELHPAELEDADDGNGGFLCEKCRRKKEQTQVVVQLRQGQDGCLNCGKEVDGSYSSDIGDLLCASCRKDPKAALLVLGQAMKKGAPGLDALRGLKVVKMLGRGAVGAAFLVRRGNDGPLRALKILLPEMASNKWARESFLREVENTKILNHPNVVRLHDSGSSHGIFFYTLEYCDGGSVDKLMAARGGTISVAEATRLILQSLDGLDHIHNAVIPKVKLASGKLGQGKGLVHRDLKPANIFLTGSGKRIQAKIADVGVGKAFDTAGLSGQTMTGSVAGTPVYMPRQQVINFKYAKPDVDVWALAATYYVMLTGEYPREFNTGMDPWRVVLETSAIPILQRNSSIPRRLAEVIDQALVDKPSITFQTAIEFKKGADIGFVKAHYFIIPPDSSGLIDTGIPRHDQGRPHG